MKILRDGEWRSIQKQRFDQEWECKILKDEVRVLKERVGEGVWGGVHPDLLSPDRVSLTEAVAALMKHLGVEVVIRLPEPKQVEVILGRTRAPKA